MGRSYRLGLAYPYRLGFSSRMKSYSFKYRHNAAKSPRVHVEKLNNDAEAIEFARGLRMGGAYRVEIFNGKRQVEYRNS